MTIHTTLLAQLRQHGLIFESLPDAVQDLLEDISEHYRSSENDFALVERSLSLSSEELLQHNEQLEKILDFVDEVYFHINNKEIIQRYKHSDLFLAKPNESALDKSLEQALHPSVYESVGEMLRSARTTGKGVHSKFALHSAEDTHTITSSVQPKINNEYIVVFKDVTETERQALALTQSMERISKFNDVLVRLNKASEQGYSVNSHYPGILTSACETLELDYASLWLFNEQNNSLECALERDQKQLLFNEAKTLSLSGQPRFFESWHKDRVTKIESKEQANNLWGDEIPDIIHPESQSALIVPIQQHSYNAGILLLECDREQQWRNEELQFAASLSDLLRLLFERAEKYEIVEALNQSENRFKTLTETSEAAIFAFNDRFLYTNPAFRALTGLNEEEIEKASPSAVLGENFIRHHESTLLAGSKGDKSEIEIELKSSIGETHWLYITSARTLIEGQTCWLSSAFDITERKTIEAKLRFQVYHDQLTGLPNRLRMVERIGVQLARASRDKFYKFGLIMVNLDRFKLINDSLGHIAGDQLLLEMSKRLRVCIRRSDLASRIDSDEFALLFENLMDPSELDSMIATVQTAVTEPIVIDGHEAHCTAAIGAVIGHADYNSAEQLLRDASIAMYKAKGKGLQQVCYFDTEMHEKARKVLEIESDLRKAIEKQHLELFYQPVIDLATGRLAYFEALIRWRKSRSNIVAPGYFIPAAEESGAIVRIGEWIIGDATRQARQWSDEANRDIGISINISGRQFADLKLLETLENALVANRIQPGQIGIELTESSMIENSETIRNTLKTIRDLGCDILVDDFGTGYSSLSYLHKFPVNTIKIDRSFVASMEDSKDNEEVVRAIIHLGHNLNLKVVAEGVETQSQLDILIRLGCDLAQGFLLSHPVEAKVATTLIDKQFC
jgi:diguanylate cyclase (GGDEF)-like protein/PAS domain S-box-containing protein